MDNEPYVMMHRKNFRIVHANNETMKNGDFIGITKKQFERVDKDKSYGLVILKEEEQAKRRADYAEAQAYIASYGGDIDIPLSVSMDSSEKTIDDMTIQELRKVAKELGITVHSKDSREEIQGMIATKLEDVDAESTVQD